MMSDRYEIVCSVVEANAAHGQKAELVRANLLTVITDDEGREMVNRAIAEIFNPTDLDLRTELPALQDLIGTAMGALFDEHEGNLRDALVELAGRAAAARDLVVNW